MNQGGKHAGEPGRFENNRERRRGAAGRAAALRRAPSDSDCSAETASLSADSGDRAPRHLPLAPPRSGKTRSRRRGSEWEVLEGLKDGQRFEMRPDVFNGYLHKKRKWPLKGWHKRFFVIDGGILVYARSPTDVARGRLHGSVDVGLSVISAKARRRRIDIDADEFIYHLRAKTPEVFRTWLNILKAHRLYRQHLLTFGARESVPKIHPPLDDLPATDTSSHTSITSDTSTSETSVRVENPDPPNPSLPEIPMSYESSDYNNKDQNLIYNWQQDSSKGSLIPLNFESLEEKEFDLKLDDALHTHKSLCSMHCMEKRYIDEWKRRQSPNNSLNTTDAEKQITFTDLQLNSLRNINQSDKSLTEKITNPYKLNDHNPMAVKISKEMNYRNEKTVRKRSPFFYSQLPSTTACFFFTRKKAEINNEVMRKSKKCTNLVKYKNLSDEPPLKMQSSKCMLLRKYKLTTKHVSSEKAKHSHRAVACDAEHKKNINNGVQVKMENNENKASIAMETADYDTITEKLMVSIFQTNIEGEKDIKYYIDQVIKDLYNLKVDQAVHPVKALFRNLLEYWLKNTSVTPFKEAMKNDKSIDKQSNKCFTKDESLSSYVLKMKSKQTQFHGLSDGITQYKVNKNVNAIRQKVKDSKCEDKVLPKCSSPRRDTESFEKERRIQELERLLRSTVYVCETARDNTNKEKDIRITKKLINNLSKLSRYNDLSTSEEKPAMEKSSSSANVPEMQDTINHLINETSIPPDVAKEFFGAYLDVLLQDNNKSTTTSQSSESEKQSQENLACHVAAESVVKRVSKSVATFHDMKDFCKKNEPIQSIITNVENQVDPGQDYLKDILDKVTTIFSKVKKDEDNNTWHPEKLKQDPKTLKSEVHKTIKDELGRPVFGNSQNNLVYENCHENSLVIDLCKYKLEHISMLNDPELKGVMSITIKLKEKPPNHGESKQTHLNLKFADNVAPLVTHVDKPDIWMPFINPDDSTSNEIFDKVPLESNKITCLDFEARDVTSVKPFLSNSDGTSNARRPLNTSYNSIEEPILARPNYEKDNIRKKTQNDDLQSCYIMSFKSGALASKFSSKKKSNIKKSDAEGEIIKPNEYSPSTSSAANKPTTEQLSSFDKCAPRIIDERFILLLLENLTFLSRNVPYLHKDISSLYVKLRKRHEKMVKNCNNIQGLSLLGKIYSEDICGKDGDDRGTQFDPYVNQDTIKTSNIKDASTNTNINKVDEKCVSTYTPIKKIVHSGVQAIELTDDIEQTGFQSISHGPRLNHRGLKEISRISPIKRTRDSMVVTETETIDIVSADESTSKPNCCRIPTKDRELTTCLEYALDGSSSSICPIMLPGNKIETENLKNCRKYFNRRQQLIKEISRLSSSIKVSTPSQTERFLVRYGFNTHLEKDYNIYQLYLSNKCAIKASSSMTTLNGGHADTSDELKTLYRCSSDPSNCSGLLSPTTPTIRGPQAGFVSGTPGGRLAGWIIESGGPLENASRELGQAQLSVQQLQRLLDALESQHQVHHDTDVSIEGASPNVKKDRRKFGLRKKKSNSKCASVDLAPPHIDLSTSHTALSSISALTAPPSPGGGASSMPNSAASLPIACAAARPQSLPGAEALNTAPGPSSLTSLTPDHQLREDFTVLAKDLVTSLKSIVSGLVCERGRLRAALEAAESAVTPGGAVVATLRTNLTSALQQNSELRTRLSRIHDASDMAEIMSVANSEAVNLQFQQSMSYSSSCVSASEFFDAEEHDDDDDDKQEEGLAGNEAGVIELDGDSSSEAGSLSSEEGSASSDNSDGAMVSAEQVTLRMATAGTGSPLGGRDATSWSRRTRLPAPRPSPGGPSLWNLLYKNIGKDLSQISMPVTINEPLNMLQRLCEELEYSELLDSAAECPNAVERMCLVAAFAVSAYAASAHRAASKPFNPLLAETYECVRDDRQFRFLAEQVSHHPPISACHAESPRWCFWQEARIKTKFWGKSMEFQPTGRVHVKLKTTGDHYTWNKVTTCVHNLFGGQRWVDQYGDMHIVCVGTDISCKLNFIKASSWSQTRHEVRGAITEGNGKRVRLAGRWSEALYAGEPPAARCLWRPGAMPPEHGVYYGFTRFAMELNEMEPGMRELLPHTDTRFRPDQRALEEGDVEGAETFKLQLEHAQRERRRDSQPHAPAWFRKTLENGEETWVFSGEYWKAREAGFSENVAPRIW